MHDFTLVFVSNDSILKGAIIHFKLHCRRITNVQSTFAIKILDLGPYTNYVDKKGGRGEFA